MSVGGGLLSCSLPQTRDLENAGIISKRPPRPPPQLNDVSDLESGAQKQNKPRARRATRSARARRTHDPPPDSRYCCAHADRRDARALCAASRKQQRGEAPPITGGRCRTRRFQYLETQTQPRLGGAGGYDEGSRHKEEKVGALLFAGEIIEGPEEGRP